jgi:hypothetical protein
MKEQFMHMKEYMNMICQALKELNNFYLIKSAMICISNISSLGVENYASSLLSLLIEILASHEVNQEHKTLAITTIGDIYLNSNLIDYTDDVLSMIFSASEAVSELSDKLSVRLKESIIECLTSINFANSNIGPNLLNVIRMICDEKFKPSDTLLKNSLFLLADIYSKTSLPEAPFIDMIMNRLKSSRFSNTIQWAENILYKIK